MRKIFIFLGVLAFMSSCGPADSYKITGKVENPELEGLNVYLAEQKGNTLEYLDSAKVENGKFVFTGKQDSIELKWILFKLNGIKLNNATMTSLPIFLENGNMNVVIDSVSTVTGTASNDIFQNYKKMMSPYDNRLRDIMMTFWSKNSAGTLTKEEEKALNTQYETILDSVNDINKSFIMNGNLDNEVGAYIFLISNQNLDESDVIEIIDAAGPKFKAFPRIDNFVKRAEILKSVTIGKPFVELTMQDVNGKEVKLSDFAGKGKYLVVDFWASWCPPCRAEAPAMVEIYKAYKDKGVDFLGISLDQEKDKWVSGIKELGLSWNHMSDLKGWNSAANTVYGINAIPHVLLIDPNGTIIAKYLNSEKLTQVLGELIK
ncbi:MAG TPA: AhpC/TSA family protein [Candidatus Gallibacteroides avistercoris]|uniref:AhpC/TSA family protein n=1 Tax=Candidatus Gallibacteroides avistercoris TaxID=2840833 RepID=A0A9D1M650_9BACT|nr:AhpC/TSA family protein [Candidatus Gallibacteroides avistercoris]